MNRVTILLVCTALLGWAPVAQSERPSPVRWCASQLVGVYEAFHSRVHPLEYLNRLQKKYSKDKEKREHFFIRLSSQRQAEVIYALYAHAFGVSGGPVLHFSKVEAEKLLEEFLLHVKNMREIDSTLRLLLDVAVPQDPTASFLSDKQLRALRLYFSLVHRHPEIKMNDSEEYEYLAANKFLAVVGIGGDSAGWEGVPEIGMPREVGSRHILFLGHLAAFMRLFIPVTGQGETMLQMERASNEMEAVVREHTERTLFKSRVKEHELARWVEFLAHSPGVIEDLSWLDAILHALLRRDLSPAVTTQFLKVHGVVSARVRAELAGADEIRYTQREHSFERMVQLLDPSLRLSIVGNRVSAHGEDDKLVAYVDFSPHGPHGGFVQRSHILDSAAEQDLIPLLMTLHLIRRPEIHTLISLMQNGNELQEYEQAGGRMGPNASLREARNALMSSKFYQVARRLGFMTYTRIDLKTYNSPYIELSVPDVGTEVEVEPE